METGGLGLGAQGEDQVSLGWEESPLISEAGGLWRLLLLLGGWAGQEQQEARAFLLKAGQ